MRYVFAPSARAAARRSSPGPCAAIQIGASAGGGGDATSVFAIVSR
jgi:hypothetical protein